MWGYIIVYIIFSQVWVEKTFSDFSDGKEFVEYDTNFIQWNLGIRILPTAEGRLKIIGQDWDFNDDGYRDIALTYQYKSMVKIFWNSQNGFDTTNFHQFKNLNPAPQHILVVDLNNDGIEDFIIPSSHGPYTDSKINIYYGDSTGYYPEFPDEVITRCPPSTEDAKAADFNKDGYLDLIFSGRDTTFIILGPPPFASKPWWKFISWPGGHHDFANPADFNSDGEIDIAIYRHNQGYIRIYYGPDFATYTHLNTPPGRGIEIADLNKDGYLDIVHDGDAHGIYWGSPQGYSDNNYTSLSAEPAFGDICIQDFNKDGNLDILLNGNDYAYVFWGNSFSNFTRVKQEWRAECALSADWNNDGYMDIAVSSPFGNYTYLFYNVNGDFNYNPDFTFHMGSNNALEIDLGNIYTREGIEGYISNVYNTGMLSNIDSVRWFGNFPPPCSLVFEIRYSNDGINWSNWVKVRNGENISINNITFIQYRIKFFTDFSHTTKFYIDSVKIYYSPPGNYALSVEPDTFSSTYENVPISYLMRVKNLGDYGDTVLLSSYSSANGVFSQIYDSSGTYQIDKIFVDSGETKNIILRIIPPPSVPDMLVDTTILEGAFKSYPLVKDKATVITYILKQGTEHGILVEPDTSGITQVSMPVVYNMRVYNYGFVDDTVLLSVRWKRSDMVYIILDSLGINPIDNLFVKSLKVKRFKLKVIPPNMLTTPFIYDTATVRGAVKVDTNVKDIAFVYTQVYDPRFTYDIVIEPDTFINTIDKNISIPMKLYLKNSPFDSVNLSLFYNEDSIECFLVDTLGNGIGDLKVSDTFYFNLNINISKGGELRDTIKVLGVSYLYPNSKDTAFVILVKNPEVKKYTFDIHNYESPFRLGNGTNFVITLPEDGFLTLKIYDRLGREIKMLVSHKLFNKGEHLIFWDGRDNYGRLVSPGTYIYVAEFKSLKGIERRIVKKTGVVP